MLSASKVIKVVQTFFYGPKKKEDLSSLKFAFFQKPAGPACLRPEAAERLRPHKCPPFSNKIDTT